MISIGAGRSILNISPLLSISGGRYMVPERNDVRFRMVVFFHGHSFPSSANSRRRYMKEESPCKECISPSESFILSRMKATPKNVKPVIIVDDSTKECSCKIPNEALTGFTNADDTYTQILCFKVHKIADYMIKKYNIQKSNKTPEQKRKEIEKLIK